MGRRLWAVMALAVAALVVAVPAFGFDCSPAKKPPLAGAVALVNITNDNVTILKSNPGDPENGVFHGGFIALTDGTSTVSTFVHAPGGELPPVRDGGPQDNCDGKGLDSLEVCFGG